jgi:DNA repair protein RadC
MYSTAYNQTIKFWAEDDQPREKLMLKGKNALSDAELLAILLGSGTKQKSAVELAQEILDTCNRNLADFSRLTQTDLLKFKGIGDAKAVTLLAAMELARRRNAAELPERIQLQTSQQVYEFLKGTFADLNHEEFHLLLLNRRNQVLKTVKISQGGISSTIVDGKLIFKAALEWNAVSIVLAHNHPSGSAFPSSLDIQLTKSLVQFGKMIELIVIDHLIFTDNGYFSFSDKGML